MKYVLLLFVMLLASCSQVEQKRNKKVEETVNEVKETIEVTVIQKNIKRKSYRNQKLR